MVWKYANKVVLAAMLLTLAMTVTAQEGPPPAEFPRYASLKKGEVNVRSGPGNQYPVLWVYQRSGYPVQLLARYDNYYKVRDAEGEEGWVFVGMVSGRRTALVDDAPPGTPTGPAPLYRSREGGAPLARLAAGVVVALDGPCTGDLCAVTLEGLGDGWVEKQRLLMVE